MSGLLGERVFCFFCDLRYMGVAKNNTDVNTREVLGRGCEVTRVNDVMAACLTPVIAWRKIMEKKGSQ